MAQSNIQVFGSIVHTVGTRTEIVGSENVPVESTGTNATTGRIEKKRITIAASQTTAGQLLWDGTLTGAIRDWTLLSVQCVSASSAIELYWVVAQVVSDATPDLSPTGTRLCIPDSLSCGAMRVYDDNRVWMNATVATVMGVTGTSPGTPNVIGSDYANNKLYKRFALWALNRGTAAATVEISVMD